MNKLCRQLLSGFLVLTLGITSTIPAYATETNELDWEVVNNLVTKVNKFTPDEKDETIDENEDVRALIVFEGKSIVERGFDANSVGTNWLAKYYVNKLEKQQDAVLEDISNEVLDGEDVDVRYRFTVMTNAVSTEITYGDVLNIREVKGVEDVYVLPQYEPQTADTNTITSGDMVGSYNVWESGYTGAGMRIAVIDTGLDTDHPSFDANAYLYALEEQATKDGKTVADYDLMDVEDIEAVFEYLNATYYMTAADGTVYTTPENLYLNEKVPFAFNYVDATDAYVNHENDTQGDHGTHVSGIATANKYVPQADGTYAPQENGVAGIAPNAQLMVMKVFGANGGAYTDDYMSAIQDALLLGADSVNLSLGSGNPGESSEYEATEQYVNYIMDALAETDTVVAFSAGNSYMWADFGMFGGLLPEDVMMQTNGSPGSYANSFTVASAENTGMTGYMFSAANTNVIYTESTGYGNPAFTTLDTNGEGTEYEYVVVPGIGQECDYYEIDVTGKIAIVSRGTTSFFEKANLAYEKGAIGVVVMNNVAGAFGMDLTGLLYPIPTVSITLEDGVAIKEGSESYEVEAIDMEGNPVVDEEENPVMNTVYTGTMTVYSTATTIKDYYENAFMSDFSSWGVPGDLSLKPEITAPGGNIWSTYDNGLYGNMSGTSMASPSIAGMSALVIEYIEENNLVEKTGLSARELAMTLLMSTATPLTQDETYYSPRKQGAGLANVYAATTTPVYIVNREDGKVKAELGDDPERTGTYEIKFTLYNTTDEVEYYTIDVTALTEELTQGLIVGNSYQLNPTVDVEGTKYLLDIDQDGDVDNVDALIFLQHVNESLVNDYLVNNENQFDFNQNGMLDTNDVHIYLTLIKEGNVGEAVVEVVDETEVTVTITLSDEDKAYLDTNYANGMYVDGFVQLDGDVDLVVPFLAFYGNWADASMFEHVNYVDTSEDQYSYSGTYATNVFVDSYGYVVGGNSYAEEEVYLEERNAISSEFGDIAEVYYTLIRNAANVTMQVTDQETGEVYYTSEVGARLAEFYYVNAGAWYYTQNNDVFGWAVTDAEGNPLPEGTKVNVSIVAVPDYYKDSETVPGTGCTFTLPFTVDNTAPAVNTVTRNEDGTISVALSDNYYAAAVQVYNRDGELVSMEAVNQTEPGVESTITFEVDQTILDTRVLFVSVVDYAGNATTVRANLTGVEDVEVATEVVIKENGVDVTGQTLQTFEFRTVELSAYVYPETILNDAVTWTSDAPETVYVDEYGNATALAVGSATLTATSEALDANGQPVSASVTIEVVDLTASVVGIKDDWYNGTMSFNFFEIIEPDAGTALMNLSAPIDAELENYMISATDYFGYLMACDDYGNLYLNDMTTPYLNVADVLGSPLPLVDLTAGEYTGNLYGVYGPYIVWINLFTGASGAFNFGNYVGAYLNGVAYAGLDTSSDGLNCEVLAITTNDGGMYYLYQAINSNEPWEFYGVIEPTGETQSMAYNSLYYDFENDVLVNAVYSQDPYEVEGETYALPYTNFYALDMQTGNYVNAGASGYYNLYYGLYNPELFGITPADVNLDQSLLKPVDEVTFKGNKTTAITIDYNAEETIEMIELDLTKGGNK